MLPTQNLDKKKRNFIMIIRMGLLKDGFTKKNLTALGEELGLNQ
jgi:hypothetical protein